MNTMEDSKTPRNTPDFEAVVIEAWLEDEDGPTYSPPSPQMAWPEKDDVEAVEGEPEYGL